MSMILTALGEAIEAKGGKSRALHLRLFTNNHTPSKSTVAANLTEASGNGYAAIALASGSWVYSETTPTLATYPTQTFTFTGPLGAVTGAYITDDLTGVVVWAGNLGPFTIAVSGDAIALDVQIGDQ